MALCIPTLPTPNTCPDACSPTVEFARIDSIRFRLGDAPFADFGDNAEWAARLSDSAPDTATEKYIRTIYGIGDYPESSTDKIEFSLDRVLYSEKQHTINFEIDNICQAHLDLLRFTEEHPSFQYRVWFTGAKSVHGGNEGVLASFVMKKVISANRKELVKIKMEISFKGLTPLTKPLPEILKV